MNICVLPFTKRTLCKSPMKQKLLIFFITLAVLFTNYVIASQGGNVTQSKTFQKKKKAQVPYTTGLTTTNITMHNKKKIAQYSARKKNKFNTSSQDKLFDFFKIAAGTYFSESIKSLNNVSTDEQSFAVSAALGKKIYKDFSLDVEYNYRHPAKVKMYNVDSQTTTYQEWKVTSHMITLNGKLFVLPSYNIKPYIRAGIGMSLNKSSDYVTAAFNNSSSTHYPGKISYALAAQLGGGISMIHSQSLNSEIEYMYSNRGKFKTQGKRVTRTSRAERAESVPPHDGKIKDHIITYGFIMRF